MVVLDVQYYSKKGKTAHNESLCLQNIQMSNFISRQAIAFETFLACPACAMLVVALARDWEMKNTRCLTFTLFL
jgi:hypothetical protein